MRTVVRNNRRQDDLPRFLTYTVTFGCNAKCIMCDSWKIPAKGDLELDELEGIFQQLPRMDAVRLTGGEPFVRRDLGEIAKLAQQHLQPTMIHITTNGFLTDRIVEFCEQRDKKLPLHLLISVDGMEEKHNQVRGSSLAWRSVMATIDALADRKKELNIKMAINQTIVDVEGAQQYRELNALMKPKGIPIYIVMAYDLSATYSVERDVNLAPTQIGEFTTFGDFPDSVLKELLDEAEENTKELPMLDRWGKRYYIRGIRNRLLGNSGQPNPKCIALNSHLRLFPNGDIPTCQFNSQIVGNLREQSFAEIWNGMKAAEMRSWVRKCPGCWAECEVLPSAIYTLDLLKKNLPFAKV